ncbi:hypothetical protein LXT12_20565 [Pelomonas sp. P7]|uniref:Uncharacterized protein n=1 Tax=Pelomonas caseinilytica TaxID=2906763 RepID=A0ABS8XFI0_9BURK|nr:hypothetical protein [Pelomonas sp. P7]MCE4539649.1 hypothetical protein [Pelomonas sp. P7]
MTDSQVLAAVPWVSALGSWLLVGSLYTSGPVAQALTALSLVLLLACLGALLTRFPRR